MSEYHEEVVTMLKSHAPEGAGLEIPPKVFGQLGGRFMDYVPNKSLHCNYTALEDYAGPDGNLPCGIVSALIDNVYGPFAMLCAARPCTTVHLSVMNIRPLEADGRELTVEVHLRYKSRSILFLEAKVTNADGRTVATSATTMAAVREKDKD